MCRNGTFQRQYWPYCIHVSSYMLHVSQDCRLLAKLNKDSWGFYWVFRIVQHCPLKQIWREEETNCLSLIIQWRFRGARWFPHGKIFLWVSKCFRFVAYHLWHLHVHLKWFHRWMRCMGMPRHANCQINLVKRTGYSFDKILSATCERIDSRY